MPAPPVWPPKSASFSPRTLEGACAGMSQGGGVAVAAAAGGGRRHGGAPYRERGPNRGGFQGGRRGGRAITPALRWKSHPKCINAFNHYHECVDYCFQRIGHNQVGKAHPDCEFAAFTSHKCDKICVKRRFRQYMARVREGIVVKGGRRLHPKCINASNPYHECVNYCFKKIMDQMRKDSKGATEQDSQGPNTSAATKEASSGFKRKSSTTFANTVGEDTKNMESKKVEATTSATTTTILEDIKPMISKTVAKEMDMHNFTVCSFGESNQDMQRQTQAAPLPPPTTIAEDVKPKLPVEATRPCGGMNGMTENNEVSNSMSTLKRSDNTRLSVTAVNSNEPGKILPEHIEGTIAAIDLNSATVAVTKTDQEHEKAIAAEMVQSTRVIELEGLEEEVKKQREARELRKRRKIEIPYPSNGDSNIEELEYRLTLKLLEYERLGYLTKVENEDDDESLVQYGDIFGMAVLNEYPRFFIQVPQHPHYRERSLEKVKREMAENFWDLLMPLIRRGISAVRENKETEIAAVEQMITRFTEEGFNLKHLQAYINTSRRARANTSFLKDELEKAKAEIEIEEKEINDILSGRPLCEVIKELETNKAMYENFINKILSDIDASLAKSLRLLDKEKVVRDTKTTPAHTALLDWKEHLEIKLREANNEAWTLLLD